MVKIKACIKFLLLLVVIGCACSVEAKQVVLPNGCVLITQRCKSTFKQVGRGFEVEGLKVSGTGEIGKLKLDPKLLQQLTAVGQLLDQMTVARCNDLNRLTTCDASRERLIAFTVVAREHLNHLAILAQLYSAKPEEFDKALLVWLAQAANLIDKSSQWVFLSGGDDKAKEIARSALEYASDRLGITDNPTEFERILGTELIGISGGSQ